MVDRLNINLRFEENQIKTGDLIEVKTLEFPDINEDSYIPRVRIYKSLDDVRYRPLSSSLLREHKSLKKDVKCYAVAIEVHPYNFSRFKNQRKHGWTKEEWFGFLASENPVLKRHNGKNYIEALKILLDKTYYWIHSADVVKVLR